MKTTLLTLSCLIPFALLAQTKDTVQLKQNIEVLTKAHEILLQREYVSIKDGSVAIGILYRIIQNDYQALEVERKKGGKGK